MSDTPALDWITKGEKYTPLSPQSQPTESRYRFKAPFNEVGEPFGDLFRGFFSEWKVDLIPSPITSSSHSPYEGIYSQRKSYMHNVSESDDQLRFSFSINSQGKLKGLILEGHHSHPVPTVINFLTNFAEFAPDIEYFIITDDFIDSFPSKWPIFSLLDLIIYRCPRLISFPNNISRIWPHLHQISLYNIPNEVFPSSLCYFPELTDLTLEVCPNLHTLPPEIGQLTNLKRLSIINCPQFTHLPPEIGQLTNLWGIDLVDLPQFTYLPPEIGQLSDFRGITLSYLPKLLEITPEIGQCLQLRSIELDHLPLLRTLPDTLGQCRLLHQLKIDGSVFLDSLPASLVHTSLTREPNATYYYFHDKVVAPLSVHKKISVTDQRFVLSHDPIESLDRWIHKRGELGLDVDSARAFKAWFIENIPPRAYPWFGGLDGHQPIHYEQIQWFLTHPHPFRDDDLDWIDQQVSEWADYDCVGTRTHADWKRLKRELHTKKPPRK